MTFAEACAPVGSILDGTFRRDVIAEIGRAPDLTSALGQLRTAIRANSFRAGATRINLDPAIAAADRKARAEGLHVLHDWDGKAARVNAETIAVEVLDYVRERSTGEGSDAEVLAILLDYYLLYVLALLSMRVWDDGDADDHLVTLNDLVARLQGPGGSGHRFVSNAETLILVATSHYEADEAAYDRLLQRVRALDVEHRTNVGLGHAGALGCHLRFGFEATYGQDIRLQRDDNTADYPWLCFGVLTSLQAWVRRSASDAPPAARDEALEAVLGGLTTDAAAFVADRPPKALETDSRDWTELRDLIHAHRGTLAAEFERFRPTERAYSPLSFRFNFSQNVVKGIVIDALLWGEPRDVSLNDLFAGAGTETAIRSREAVARALTNYARASPDTIRGRPTPAIVYDPSVGRRAFARALRELRA